MKENHVKLNQCLIPETLHRFVIAHLVLMIPSHMRRRTNLPQENRNNNVTLVCLSYTLRMYILISNCARLLEPFEDAPPVHGALEDNGYWMSFQKESRPTESDGN